VSSLRRWSCFCKLKQLLCCWWKKKSWWSSSIKRL